MDTNSFGDRVSRHFRYLIDDYGFELVGKDNVSVTYQTETCRVRVVLDVCQIGVEIRPAQAPVYENAWIDLWDVVHCKNPAARFKYACNPGAYGRDPAGYVDREAARLAKVLRRYADDMLRGDFSRREELERFRTDRIRRDFGGAITP